MRSQNLRAYTTDHVNRTSLTGASCSTKPTVPPTFAVICVASRIALAVTARVAQLASSGACCDGVPSQRPGRTSRRCSARGNARRLPANTRAPNFTRHVSTENRRAMSQQITVTNHFGGCPMRPERTKTSKATLCRRAFGRAVQARRVKHVPAPPIRVRPSPDPGLPERDCRSWGSGKVRPLHR